MPLSIDYIVISIVLIFIVCSLYFEVIGPSFTFVIAVATLGIAEILTPKEILQGFANEQLVIVLLLLIVGDIIRQSHLISTLFNRMFSQINGRSRFISRMITIVATLSAFLNNTPLVAIMMPYIHTWCKKNNISRSKMLIPLSYAAILGGSMTLIGTSTNLMVNGIAQDQGFDTLGIYDFFIVGFPMAIIGGIYLLLFSNKLLPDKDDSIKSFQTKSSEYITQAIVSENSKLIGSNIEESSSLKQLKGLYLINIQRNGVNISGISKHTPLVAEDRLTFAGDTKTIVDLISEDVDGLYFPSLADDTYSRFSQKKAIEIVISVDSTLVGKSVLEAKFRKNYDAAIIAIQRGGKRIEGKISNVKLRAGDAVLIYAGHNFNTLASKQRDFYIISLVKEISQKSKTKDFILLGGLGIAITLASLNLVPLFTGLIILLIIVAILKIYPAKSIHNSLDYNLAMVMALSLSIGTAMIKTGFAADVADVLLSLLLPYGKYAVILGIYLITTLLANFITNKAAVAIMFPIAVGIASHLSIDPHLFILVVAFASAANFMTPVGYQTNLMVYGPGGYSSRDFFKIGAPLTFIYMIVATSILYIIYLT